LNFDKFESSKEDSKKMSGKFLHFRMKSAHGGEYDCLRGKRKENDSLSKFFKKEKKVEKKRNKNGGAA